MTKYPRKTAARDPQAWRDWDAGAAVSETVILHDGARLGDNGKPYDLEERTAQFGEPVIRFAKRIPRTPVNNRLIGQLVGAATSVGANFFFSGRVR